MRAPLVFVVNMPMYFDRRLERWQKKIDLGPAATFGDMVFLTPHGHPPTDQTLVLPRMADFLERFTAEDYLLPAGPPPYMCWAAAIAARKTGGRLRLLVWSRKDDPRHGTYQVVDCNIYEMPPVVYTKED